MYKRRVKQFISLLLSGVLVVGTLPGDWMTWQPETVKAAAVETSKIDPNEIVTNQYIPNENLRNYLKVLISPDDDLTLGDLLTYTGEINLNNSSYPITQIDGIGYARGASKIIFDKIDNIVEIKDYEFNRCQATEIVMPDSVTTIGKSAFNECLNLTTINLKNVTTIEESAFAKCTSLNVSSFNSKIRKLGRNSFANCSSISSIIIENPDAVLEAGVFQGCIGLESIQLPEGLKAIPMNFLNGTKMLQTINIPTTIEIIEGYAFQGTGIAELDFTKCNDLKEVDDYAFLSAMCKQILLPDSVTKIGFGAFNASDITSMVLPRNLTFLGGSAFYACTKLVSVDIPKGVDKIDDATFYKCFILTDVKIEEQSAIKSIGKEAFYKCYMLPSFDFVSQLEELTTISDHAFEECSEMVVTDGKFPSNLQIIGDYAFYKCYSLGKITFREELESIGNYAFYQCGVRESCSNKMGWAFKAGSGLQTIDFEYATKLTSIGSYGFAECNLNSMVRLPNITKVADGTFLNCMNLEHIALPESVTYIGSGAFQNCLNLQSIELYPSTIMHQNALCGYDNPDLTFHVVESTRQQISITNGTSVELPFKLGNEKSLNATGITLKDASDNKIPEVGEVKDTDSVCYELKKVEENGVSYKKIILYGLKKVDKYPISVNCSLHYNNDITENIIIGIKLSYNVSVVEQRCESVSLPQSDFYVSIFNTAGINIESSINPTGVSEPIEWSVGNNTVLDLIAETKETPLGIAQTSKATIKPKTPGTSEIKVKVGEKQATAIVHVAVPANSIEIDKREIKLYQGFENTDKITATCRYSSEYNSYVEQGFGDSIVFESSNPNVATVDQFGNVTAVAPGNAVIKARTQIAGNREETCLVRVIGGGVTPPAEELKISVPETVNAGGSVNISAALKPSTATNKIEYYTDSEYSNIISVDANSGLIKGLSTGKAIVRVRTDNNLYAARWITVVNPVLGFNLVTHGINITIGKEYYLSDADYTTTCSSASERTTDRITWTSSNESVAKVNSNGMITAIAKGTVEIIGTATSGATIRIPVKVSSVVKSVKIPEKATIKKGKTLQLNPSITPVDANGIATWTTSNNKVVVVTNTGLVKAVGAGNANITVMMNSGVSATCNITVTIPSKSIKIKARSASSKKLYLVKGRSVTLSQVMSPSNTTDQVKWSTSNKKVVKVNANTGVIRGLKTGKAKITAKTTAGKKATIQIYVVKKALSAKKVTLPSKKTVKKGKTLQLTAKVTKSNSTDTISWRSKSSKIASVDAYGKVTGRKKGTTYIYVTTSSGKTAKCKIKVK